MVTAKYCMISIALVLLCLNGVVFGDEPLTAKDRQAVKKFLPMVQNILPHEYMKQPGYLLRWIRTKKYDLEDAKDLLTKSIEWRKENNIDSVKYNKNSALAKDFPIDVSGVDNDGRPVMLADWTGDIRKVVVAGKRKKLKFHFASAMELVEQRMRALNVHNNNSQWIGIYDFNKFTTPTHLCVQCLPVYLDHALLEENNYPLGAKEYIIINAPRIFQTVLRLVGPILQDTLNRITTFGSNREEWQAHLLKRIPADQLPPQFGGTRR